ncbi:MAG: hypothetical protein NZ899_05330 [Thermoguttaceae bacterium]|nr:hypothetical protein [Thermoguttaceae bacterium]MDW8078261.1 hypothetical protein [Thermoguttaceae bacterium]
MRAVIAVLLALSLVTVVGFAVFMASAQVLDTLGDPAAATVCRYLSLALALGWVIEQILLLSALAAQALGLSWPGREPMAGENTWPADEAGAMPPEEDDEESSALPPRG